MQARVSSLVSHNLRLMQNETDRYYNTQMLSTPGRMLENARKIEKTQMPVLSRKNHNKIL